MPKPKIGKYYYIITYPMTMKKEKYKDGILVKVIGFKSKEGWREIYGEKVVHVKVIKKSPSPLFRNWNRYTELDIDSIRFEHATEINKEKVLAVLM